MRTGTASARGAKVIVGGMALMGGADAAAIGQVEVLFEQPSRAGEGETTNGYYSSLLWDELVYDDVTLERSVDLSVVHVWGYNFQYDPEIRVRVSIDTGVGVGELAGERLFAPGAFEVEPSGGRVAEGGWVWDEQLATFRVEPPIRLEAGVSYWISVQGQTELGWSYEALGGNHRIMYSSADLSEVWDQHDTDMALRLLGEVAHPADLAEPFGVLNFADVASFLGAFATQAPGADLAEPAGVWDLSDVGVFLASFDAG
ncbi:MAG: GC-type dockerin domain-anchored protein [Phycisphaerales bacterium JB059]